MRNIKKRMIALLALACAIFVLGGCAKTSSQIEQEAQTAIRAENVESIKTYTENYFVNTFLNIPRETFQEIRASQKGQGYAIFPYTMTFDNEFANRWDYFESVHGAVTDAYADQFTRNGDTFSSRTILTGSDGAQMALTVTFDKNGIPISSTLIDYTDDSSVSLAQKLTTAGGHTITGLLVVFGMLIFLSLIISMFRFIGKASVPPTKKAAAPAAKAAAPAPAAAPAAVPAVGEEINLADEGELVAVIAAAIAASEEIPMDGFVVRSIRRVKSNKWR